MRDSGPALLVLASVLAYWSLIQSLPYLRDLKAPMSPDAAISLVLLHGMTAGLFAAGLGTWSAVSVFILSLGWVVALSGTYGYLRVLQSADYHQPFPFVKFGEWFTLFLAGLGILAAATLF